MPRPSSLFPAGDFPFLLARRNNVVYEVSQCAEPLGSSFVLRVCQEVERQKLASGVQLKTWLDNYVLIAETLLGNLVKFCADQSITPSAHCLNEAQWLCFGEWLTHQVQLTNSVTKTRNKRTILLNRLLLILYAADVIPIQIDISPGTPSGRAKAGESRFTQKGWNHSVPQAKVETPFSFRIEAHARSYDYEPFRHLGRQFLVCLAPQLKAYYEGYSAAAAKKMHNTVLSLLRFLVQSREASNFSGFFAELESPDFALISSTRWEHVLYAWREGQLATDNGPKTGTPLRTAHGHVLELSRVWMHLAASSLVPEVSLVGFKNGKRQSNVGPRPSLAQLYPKAQEISVAEADLFSRINKYFAANEQSEAQSFIRALCSELAPDTVRSLSISSITDEIQKLNSKRISALRACAEKDFLKWHAHWENGQRILAATNETNEHLIDLLDSKLRSPSERQRNSSMLLLGGKDDARLGRALKYVIASQGGIATGLQGRYHHVARNFGGRPIFYAYMHPHPEAVAALWVLLMVDTGANCEVVRQMPFDCLQSTNDPNTKKVIFAGKGRSGGKVIVDELNIEPALGASLSAIDAIERYKKMSARYRAEADANVASVLFLHDFKAAIIPLQEWTARSWFIALTKRHSQLAGLSARPSFIRPSVLLDVQHRHIDGAVAAQAVADHINVSTTLGHYTGRTPTKLIYAQKIREFQDRFQAVIIASIDGAAAKLGLSEEQHLRIFSEAARTGLGVACLNPRAGVQPGTKVNQDCTRLDACHGCEMRWVVGTVTNIADLILFHERLAAAQIDANSKLADTWEQRWLPWFVFSDLALTKLSQGETAAVYREAMQLAAERRPTYKPFPLN